MKKTLKRNFVLIGHVYYFIKNKRGENLFMSTQAWKPLKYENLYYGYPKNTYSLKLEMNRKNDKKAMNVLSMLPRKVIVIRLFVHYIKCCVCTLSHICITCLLATGKQIQLLVSTGVLASTYNHHILLEIF